VNAAGGRSFRDFVDLNTIPLGIVDGIEVLKDGASAIYGADAIAGVVNIRTRRNFDGIETRLNYGQTSRDDGETLSADLAIGHSFGRASVLFSASYVNTDPILTMDRSLTAVASVAPTTWKRRAARRDRAVSSCCPAFPRRRRR
jgi:iron complex outermembrane receptor protein